MLAGVGGKTIAEAQSNLTVEEFLRWVEYRQLRGPLFLGPRLDSVASIIAASHGAKKEGLNPYAKPAPGGHGFDDWFLTLAGHAQIRGQEDTEEGSQDDWVEDLRNAGMNLQTVDLSDEEREAGVKLVPLVKPKQRAVKDKAVLIPLRQPGQDRSSGGKGGIFQVE